MRRRHPVLTLPLLTWAMLIAALAGCSAEAPADRASARDGEVASAASGGDASAGAAGCELLTAGEIQEATGMAPDRAEAGSGAVRQCDWSLADGRPLVAVVVGSAHRTYEQYMQNLREQMGSGLGRIQMTRVEGVGDYAIWHAQDGPDYLNVVEDGALLVVMIWRDPANGKPAREATIELARKALPRL